MADDGGTGAECPPPSPGFPSVTDEHAEVATGEPVVDVYWRRGCGFCSSMRVALREAGIEARWHDIWADPAAAALVRRAANGNETVPTVAFDGRVLVAPRPAQVVRELQAAHPELVVAGAAGRRWPPRRVLQWVGIMVILVAGVALSRAGLTALSWAAAGLAVAFYLVVRRLRAGATPDAEASAAS